jgi:hypothetical protein
MQYAVLLGPSRNLGLVRRDRSVSLQVAYIREVSQVRVVAREI